jgi:hypothetical protein
MTEARPTANSCVPGQVGLIGSHMLVALLAVVFAVFTSHSYIAFLSWLGRTLLILACGYGVMFVWHGRGGRHMGETFLMSFAVIGVTYFVITSPIECFIASLVVCVAVAGLFHFLE